jgi:hypothetical protein
MSALEANRISRDCGNDVNDPQANIEREEGRWAALIKKLGLKIE